MKTVLETVKISVGSIGHGESFWLGDDEVHTHVRLSRADTHLKHAPGKVYSVCRGVIHEHDEDREVSHVKITKV